MEGEALGLLDEVGLKSGQGRAILIYISYA